MTYWQVQADLRGGPGRVLFGVEADDEESAREQAVQRLGGSRTVFWLLEIPPPSERLRPGSGTFRFGSAWFSSCCTRPGSAWISPCSWCPGSGDSPRGNSPARDWKPWCSPC